MGRRPEYSTAAGVPTVDDPLYLSGVSLTGMIHLPVLVGAVAEVADQRVAAERPLALAARALVWCYLRSNAG